MRTTEGSFGLSILWYALKPESLCPAGPGAEPRTNNRFEAVKRPEAAPARSARSGLRHTPATCRF